MSSRMTPSAATDEQAPRWLDDRERQTWLAFTLATRLFWEEIERDLQRDAQLPFGYYQILVMLSGAPDRTLRMSELAQATHSSPSRLSHAVARLEAQGWIRRDDYPTDRRAAFAVLTDKGFAALTAATPSHVESVRQHLFDQLTHRQQDALREICDQLLAHLGASRHRPAATPDAHTPRPSTRHTTG